MTRKFYNLVDDMTSVHRWHVGEICAADGSSPPLRAGLAYDGPPLSAEVHHIGYVLDFSLTSFNDPVVTADVANAITRLAPRDVQLIPIDIGGQKAVSALNVLNVVDCVDVLRSEGVMVHTADGPAPDRAGQYRQIVRLVIDPTKVPPNVHVFRTWGWRVALIVSQSVKDAIEHTRATGAVFVDVTP